MIRYVFDRRVRPALGALAVLLRTRADWNAARLMCSSRVGHEWTERATPTACSRCGRTA